MSHWTIEDFDDYSAAHPVENYSSRKLWPKEPPETIARLDTPEPNNYTLADSSLPNPD